MADNPVDQPAIMQVDKVDANANLQFLFEHQRPFSELRSTTLKTRAKLFVMCALCIGKLYTSFSFWAGFLDTPLKATHQWGVFGLDNGILIQAWLDFFVLCLISIQLLVTGTLYVWSTSRALKPSELATSRHLPFGVWFLELFELIRFLSTYSSFVIATRHLAATKADKLPSVVSVRSAVEVTTWAVTTIRSLYIIIVKLLFITTALEIYANPAFRLAEVSLRQAQSLVLIAFDIIALADSEPIHWDLLKDLYLESSKSKTFSISFTWYLAQQTTLEGFLDERLGGSFEAIKRRVGSLPILPSPKPADWKGTALRVAAILVAIGGGVGIAGLALWVYSECLYILVPGVVPDESRETIAIVFSVLFALNIIMLLTFGYFAQHKNYRKVLLFAAQLQRTQQDAQV